MWVIAAFFCGLKSLFRRGNWCEGTTSKAVVGSVSQGSAQSMGPLRLQMETSLALRAVTLDSCRSSQGDVRNPNPYFDILCVLKAQTQYLEIHFPCSSWIWCIFSPPLAFHCSISVIPMVTQVESSLIPAKWMFVFFNRYFNCLFNLCNLSSSSALCRKVLQACGTHWVRIILFCLLWACLCFHELSHSSCAERLNNSPLFIFGWKFYRSISHLSKAISLPHVQVANIISMPFFTLVAFSRPLPV